MKTKLAITAILLVCLISACGVNDSHKETFNPHIDGLWLFQEMRSIPCKDNPYICKQFHDTYYVSIDYPLIYACQKRYDTSDDAKETLVAHKENLKIGRKEGEIYKIQSDNGYKTRSDSLTFKMATDTLITSMESDTLVSLSIFKELSDSAQIWHGFTYRNIKNESGRYYKKDYRQCRGNATDSTGLLFNELPLN